MTTPKHPTHTRDRIRPNAPLPEGPRVREGEPVPVHLEVRGAVRLRGEEEELHPRGEEEEGEEDVGHR